MTRRTQKSALLTLRRQDQKTPTRGKIELIKKLKNKKNEYADMIIKMTIKIESGQT